MHRAAIASAFVITLTSAAFAADVRVTPVRITLSANEPVAAMHIENAGADEILMHLRLVRWAQQGGTDVFSPTEDVVANPPEFRLGVGGDQIVRFGLQGRGGDNETAYRVFIDQVPRAEDAKANQVQTVLRISVPIFIPGKNAVPAPRWTVLPVAGKGSLVSVTNVGGAHLEVDTLVLRDGKGMVVGKIGRPAYVLPGQTHEWPITGASMKGGERVQLVAETDWQPITETLTVATGGPNVAVRP